MSYFITCCDGFDAECFAALKNDPQFKTPEKAKLTAEEIDKFLPESECLIIRSATTVTEALLAKAPKLKLVIRAGEGTDNIDKLACQKRDVRVANTPGANNNSAAEHTVAMIMSTLRKVPFAHHKMVNKGWDKESFVGNELWKKTVGIIGFGQIGQIVAKRISGFEPNILFFDPFFKAQTTLGTQVDDLNMLLNKSDVVTIHTPLNEHTKNLIGKDQLAQMKKNAILVNVARGGIVDEDALIEALTNKQIAAAAFDVFTKEPLPEDHKLRSLSNLVMTPHLGASTQEAQDRVGQMALHQVKEFFLNNNLLNEVRAK